MSRLFNLIFLLLMITQVACVSSAEKEIVNTGGVYYSTFHELPYQEIKIGETYKKEILAGTDVFDFDKGKSFFLAFQLPQNETNYQLNFSSYMMGEIIDKAYIFYPTLLILDADYAIMDTIQNDDFVFKKILFKETWGLPYKYEAKINFNEQNQEARYMIVYTTQEQLNMKTSVSLMKTIPIILPGIVGVVPIGRTEKWVKHSPVGKFQLELVRK